MVKWGNHTTVECGLAWLLRPVSATYPNPFSGLLVRNTPDRTSASSCTMMWMLLSHLWSALTLVSGSVSGSCSLDSPTYGTPRYS
jgi:hypothetical protein